MSLPGRPARRSVFSGSSPFFLSPLRKGGFILLCSGLGALVGLFILFPVNEIVYFYEHGASAPSAGAFVGAQMREVLRGLKPIKTLFYALVGSSMGLTVAILFGAILRRLRRQERLMEELGKNTMALISEGEGPELEFKSSFRWDLKATSVNRAVEMASLKSVAGFLNSGGGTLLIGVGDGGKICGLENDYLSLRRPDRDGFDQVFMTAVSSHLGADIAPYVQILFHAVEGQDVARVLVSPAPRPVFLSLGGAGPKLYVRTGAATRELNVEEALSYRAHRWG
jgi:hypothetical protein